MPSNYTPNYQLNQWEPEDIVHWEDFNADNAKIDAAIAQKADASAVNTALAQKADASALSSAVSTLNAAVADINTTLSQAVRLAAGAYTGTGAEEMFIPLPFTPKAVLVMPPDSDLYVEGPPERIYGGLAVTDTPLMLQGELVLRVETGGFRVGGKKTDTYYIKLALKGVVYSYLALG